MSGSLRGLRPAVGQAALILALSMAGQVWSAASGGWVSAPAEVRQRLGVKTASLSPEKRKSQIDAFAKVLDPGPLAQLDSDLLTAVAAAKASKAEAARSKALNAAGGTVSAKDAEAVEAQARSDALHAALLRHRLGLEWGSGIARLSDSKREQLVRALAAGTAALVHVDTPSNAGQAGAKTVDIDVGSDSAHGIVLGPARAAEPRLQSSGLIVEVSGPLAILLSVGLTQSAHIDTGSPETGVVLPRGALIRYQGSVWAYVARPGDRFERRLVADGVPEKDGLFVPAGFTAGEAVVTDGAAGLFAAELGQTFSAVK
ncbi:MAG TPA: hypothetical protein VGI79_18745 [Caulobacteraceae bacterium]|jgi:hypothetical protein